jgi:hypothetical protein
MIRFVDFEASSLRQGSFPIEVAWVDENGLGESCLIRPADEWLNPADGLLEWSPASERIHGITLATLLEHGAPHGDVALRVAEALAPSHVMACSDSPAFDGHWLQMLLAASGIRRRVKLVDVNHLYGMACRPLRKLLPMGDGPAWDRAEQRIRNLAKEIVDAAQEAEHVRQRVRHRALPDAESLWLTWRAVQENVAQWVAEEGAR